MKRSSPNPVSQTAIAKEAGVARTTVSLALRGGEGLAPETVEKVRQAAEKLGYRPNRLVHGLRSGRTGLIGVMIPPMDTFWAEVLFGVHDGLVAREYVPLVLWSNHRPTSDGEADQLSQVHRLVDWRVDGAILWPLFANLYQEHIREFTQRDLPVVTVDGRLPDVFEADVVLSDEQMGADAVAGHLLDAGHRRILHLAGPASQAWSHERCHAFAARLARAADCKLTVLELPLHGYRDDQVRDALDHPNRPTAVFAATDYFAEACYRAAEALDLRIPEDLSVVGCGDLGFATRMSPPLTSLAQCPYEMGRTAAELVADAVGTVRDQRSARVERLPMELVERASVAVTTP